jgi:hypothetical protein
VTDERGWSGVRKTICEIVSQIQVCLVPLIVYGVLVLRAFPLGFPSKSYDIVWKGLLIATSGLLRTMPMASWQRRRPQGLIHLADYKGSYDSPPARPVYHSA